MARTEETRVPTLDAPKANPVFTAVQLTICPLASGVAGLHFAMANVTRERSKCQAASVGLERVVGLGTKCFAVRRLRPTKQLLSVAGQEVRLSVLEFIAMQVVSQDGSDLLIPITELVERSIVLSVTSHSAVISPLHTRTATGTTIVENSGVLFPFSALERALLVKLPSRLILLGACQDMDHSVVIRQLRVYVKVPLRSLLLAIFANPS